MFATFLASLLFWVCFVHYHGSYWFSCKTRPTLPLTGLRPLVFHDETTTASMRRFLVEKQTKRLVRLLGKVQFMNHDISNMDKKTRHNQSFEQYSLYVWLNLLTYTYTSNQVNQSEAELGGSCKKSSGIQSAAAECTQDYGMGHCYRGLPMFWMLSNADTEPGTYVGSSTVAELTFVLIHFDALTIDCSWLLRMTPWDWGCMYPRKKCAFLPANDLKLQCRAGLSWYQYNV